MSTTTIQQSATLNPLRFFDLERAQTVTDQSGSDGNVYLPSPGQIKNECEQVQHALSALRIYLEKDNAAYRHMDLFRTASPLAQCDVARRSLFRAKAALLNEALEKFSVDEKANQSRREAIQKQFLSLLSGGERKNRHAANENSLNEIWSQLSPEQRSLFHEKATLLNDGLKASKYGENVDEAAVDVDNKEFSKFLYAREVVLTSEDLGNDSLGGIWKQLSEIIGGVAKADLDDYASALEKYTNLYQGVTNIMAQFGNWVSADGDSKMKVDIDAIRNALNDLLNKFQLPGQDGIIAGSYPGNGLSKSEADAICQKLGLEEGSLHRNLLDGTYCVVVDLAQVRAMLAQLPASKSMSIASYNAWKAGFDAQTNRIEDVLQARGQKYSNSFSRFENFHKTISSIIDSMKNMLEKFLQF